MSTLEATGPNAEQIQYWNEQAGPKWVDLQDWIDTQIAPLGLHAMDRAELAAGQHVLDVGCGCGQTTLELARRVGDAGAVTGLDISTVMLVRARERGEAAGLRNVRFENADAQTHRFEPGTVDRVFSRFGVMFFTDADAAFANLRTALRPSGRLTFVCWQAFTENPWMMVPMMAALQHIALPAPPAPDAPGPFSFADPDRVRGILTRSGYTNIAIDGVKEVLTVGGGSDLTATVNFLMQMGPAARALRDADAAVIPAVVAAMRESLVPYQTAEGIRMPSATWIVTATRG